MKTNRFKIFTACVALAAIVITLAPPAPAAEIIYGTTPLSSSLNPASNLPATVATVTATVTTNLIPIRKGQGLAIASLLTCSSGTTDAVLLCYPVTDGTNWSSRPITLYFPVNAATATRGATNLSAAVLEGYTHLNVATLTNANAGTLTNRGFLIGARN